MQLPLWDTQSTWRPPKPEQWPRWRDAKRVCIDFEGKDAGFSNDLGPGQFHPDSFICGIGVAIDGGPAVYLPVAHLGSDNVDNPEQAWAWYGDNVESFEGEWCGANVGYDLTWSRKLGYKDKATKFKDVLIADTLVYELHYKADLDSVLIRLGLPGKDKSKLLEAAKNYGLKNVGEEMYKLPARFMGAYNEGDLAGPLRALPIIEKKLLDQGSWELWNDIESELIPILVDMRMIGMRIDTKKLREVELWALEEEKNQLEKIRQLTGRQLRLDECTISGPVAQLLLAQGLPVPRAGKKNAPSISKGWLEKLDHPVAAPLKRARDVNKLRRTFVNGIWKHMIDGRIHSSYNQVRGTDERLADDEAGDARGARTGRLSADHPNLTNQPSREDFAKQFKSIFIPEDGMLWGSADFSQQEPRLVTHYAAKMNLTGALETSEAYLSDELLDNHAFMAKQTGLPRKRAKNVYLGLVYSMGEAKLCRTLGLPIHYCVSWGPRYGSERKFFELEHEAMAFRLKLADESAEIYECAGPEGKAILTTFFERAPFLMELVQSAKKAGRKYGEIVTLLGRHLHLPMLPNGKYDWVWKCLNMLIQGSAADQMKLCMVKLALAKIPGFILQTSVHDMVGGSVKDRSVINSVGKVMRNGYISPYVPFRVDRATGPSWGMEEDICYEQYCPNTAINSDNKYCPLHAPEKAARKAEQPA